MSSVGLIHYKQHDEMFRCKKLPQPLGWLTSSATLGI